MVIGNGMIARRFAAYADDDDHVIFASGVSDSGNTDMAIYNREVELLLKTIQQHPEKKLVYFSTCGIYDKALAASPYILHKLKIEAVVAEQCKAFCIFRVSNPIGFTANTHTVLNYFISCVQQHRHFEVWKKAYRNLIDLDDMYTLCHQVLKGIYNHSTIVNIANPLSYAVTEVVVAIEKHFGKKANCILIEKESNLLIDVTEIQPLIAELKIDFGNEYLGRILQKYFPLSLEHATGAH